MRPLKLCMPVVATIAIAAAGCDGLFADLDGLASPDESQNDSLVDDCDPDYDGDFGGGSGEPDKPYLLCSPAHIDSIRDHPDYMDVHFAVADDIDFGDEDSVRPIGSEDDPFQGHFEGHGFALKNFTLETSDGSPQGIFSHVGPEGQLVDITVEDVHIGAEAGVGGLVGHNEGLITDCEVHGDVEGVIAVGGVVGGNEGDIDDCTAQVRTHGSTWVGGVAGVNHGGVIQYSRSDQRLTADGDLDVGTLPEEVPEDWRQALNSRIIGGLVGVNDGEVLHSSVSDRVESEGSLVLRDNGIEATGGLVGLNSGTIVGGLFDGELRAVGNVDRNEHIFLLAVGGLVGANPGVVERSAAQGDVLVNMAIERDTTGLVEELIFVGGLVGHSNGRIENTYATGDVIVDIEQPFIGIQGVGGLVGLNSNDEGDDDHTPPATEIRDSYAAGFVDADTGFAGDDEGTRRAGGLVGATDDEGAGSPPSVVNSYWDRSTTEQSSDDSDADPLDTSDFDDESNFEGWDFDEIWTIGPAPDGPERPIFQWQ